MKRNQYQYSNQYNDDVELDESESMDSEDTYYQHWRKKFVKVGKETITCYPKREEWINKTK